MRLNAAAVSMLAVFTLTLALASQTACSSSKGQNQEQSPASQTQSRGQSTEKEPPRPSPLRSQPKAVYVTVPAGSPLQVRLDHAASTDGNRAGDRFTGSLTQPVHVNGRTVIPTGARVQGVVTNSASSGRLKGRALLSLALNRIEWGGQSYQIQTSAYSRSSAAHKKRNWTLIGGGSGVGALIGGLAGGGSGALIGGGTGAAAGVAGAALTGRRQVRIPAESIISVKTRQPLTIKLKSDTQKLN